VSGVHQVLAGAASRDAITIHALAARDVIRASGLRSEVFCEADHIDPALGGEVLPHTTWERRTEPGDRAILHYSIASPVFWWVADRVDGLAIHYHNITPARLLWEFAPRIALECAEGRRRLGELAGRVRWAAADSSFNAAELAELGFPPAEVVGVMRRASLPDPAPVERGERVRLLFVGRGVPSKAQHDLVMTLAALREAGVDAELRLVGSWDGIEGYRDHCEALAEALGVAHALVVTGSDDDQRLADEYAGADVFLCLSDHEGYCVPIVEAMEHDLPIVAYGQGAVGETAGRAALVLDEKPPSLVAEAVIEVLANDALRERMAGGRAERLAYLSHERVADRVRSFVAGMT
jgi:glycosyltransferase involved in cell wall biosynthesis